MLLRVLTASAVIPVAVVGAAAVTAYFVARRCCGSTASDQGPDQRPMNEATTEQPPHDYVRSAGPSEMTNPPKEDWSGVDEASDESFPASDPPGRY